MRSNTLTKRNNYRAKGHILITGWQRYYRPRGGIYLDKGMPDSALFLTRAGMDYALKAGDTIRYKALLVNEASALITTK